MMDWRTIPLLLLAGLLVLANAEESPVPVKIIADTAHAVLTRGDHVLKLSLGGNYGSPRKCSGQYDACISWGILGPLLTVKRTSENRYSVELSSIGSGASINMDLKGRHLYGGPVSNHWPAETAIPVDNIPYITGAGDSGSPLAVAERTWFSSNGEVLTVDECCHLFFSQTPDALTLTFENKPPYTSDNETVKFEWCLGNNAKDAYACKPQQGRDVQKEMIAKPIWSTWVRYKAAITQDIVLGMVNEVRNHSFPISTMEIDDKWETCYGNHQWDLKKFPNPRAMVQELKASGLLVTLWVHPFINTDCKFLNDSAKYMVKDPVTGEVGVIAWWNGLGGLINFMDPAAQDWFLAGLKALKADFGLSGFKFDAGEAKYIAGLMTGNRTLTEPNIFTNDYVNTAAQMGVMGEVRVGSGNADTWIFQRLQDTDTHWNADVAGLQSVLPNILTLSALGYPAVIPDMVGGNLYTANIDEELFVRWLQLNTFLPVIQFSIPPWQFSPATTAHALELCALHEKYADLIVTEIGKSDPSGRRAISPVWWLAPDDETALTTDSEFLLGEDILVAPVIHKNATSRDIYLPPGVWADGNNGTIYKGPQTIKGYPAPLYVLPYFLKQDNKEVFLVKSSR